VGEVIAIDTPERAALGRIVAGFYERARHDETLGPIFEANVKDWPDHIQRITSFWASALLRERSYSGQPMRVHQAIPGIEPSMFAIWLKLFEESVRGELGATAFADTMIARANQIGAHMARNLSRQPVILLGEIPR